MTPEKIILMLKEAEGYLSGEEISGNFQISRAAIWKYVQDLREWGYDIVAVPHLGYRLLSSPDRLFPWEIQFQLGTKSFGKEIIYKDCVTTTMDEAFQLGLQGASEGTVICTESQTKGRGRLGRHWISPKHKGVYLSLILRPELPPAEVAILTLLAAVALSEAIGHVAGLIPQIKWPNDILLNQRKLAGILTELNAETDRVKFVVIGIGLNVNTPKHLLPDTATSLKVETSRTFSRVRVMQDILRSLERWYGTLQKEGPAPILQQWRQRAITLGQRIHFSDPAGRIDGYAFDLDNDGSLLIRTDSGEIIKKVSGDVRIFEAVG
jgi:BirA family transcriptional regulator, biotin operon repressor / biotin---[acetyl-CoA-carboxylase] ligase